MMSPCDRHLRSACCCNVVWVYDRIEQEAAISKAQRRAVEGYRARLGARGLARFEVLGRDADRALIRSLARLLAEDSAAASALRESVGRSVGGAAARTGGILAALRDSPLVGAELGFTRARSTGRKVRL